MANEINIKAVAVVEPDKAGGGYDGAKRISREMLSWNPTVIAPNNAIAADKSSADSRSADMVRNDAMTRGAITIHRDSIVGAQFRLNSRPNARFLGAKEGWAEEFQEVVESRFNMLADSPENWFDASRMNTLTSMVRLAIASYCMHGEVTGSAEWIRQEGRPFKTAIQMISPTRLSNPDGTSDTDRLKSGVRLDGFGAPMGYWVRTAFPNDFTVLDNYKWKYVPATTPWGRRQFIHVIEQLMPGEARGMPEMVAALKDMRMTKNYKDIALQNAVIQASYAAAVESELPSDMVYSQLGAGNKTLQEMLSGYMNGLAEYLGEAGGIAVDGVRIPHLFPGTKLNVMPLGTPGGIGSEFEASLLRHIASALGLSYEEFARDYTKTNYSSARAANANTEKFMRSRKKIVADRFAWHVYALWLEEEILRGEIPLPTGMRPLDFYKPGYKDALCSSTWIGASRAQIDERKETEAATMRMAGNLSTLEDECAALGKDWRDVLTQRKREQEFMKKIGLEETANPLEQRRGGSQDAQDDNEDRPE